MNLIWTRSLAVSHKNYDLKGTGLRLMVQHRISRLQAAASLDEVLKRLMQITILAFPVLYTWLKL